MAEQMTVVFGAITMGSGITLVQANVEER
uniref:Uncharacterized protein n=1 Tax=Anguilla anguilla TaxID=7936 RepID=A0A0E9VRZ8_ANGAN